MFDPESTGSCRFYCLLMIIFPATFITALLVVLNRYLSYNDDLPILNRRFNLEPRIFARWRWLFNARSILQAAEQKYPGQAFRLARGDTDLTVLPVEMLPELNRLPQGTLSSRKAHTSTLLGHLNGMEAVLKTNKHVKLLLSRVTPTMLSALEPVCSRIQESISAIFPQEVEGWGLIKPVDKIVLCIGRGFTLAAFGPPLCDSPILSKTLVKHTEHVFSVAFIMRLVPSFLQPLLVWVVPDKWRLENTWTVIQQFVYQAIDERLQRLHKGNKLDNDLISCMVSEDYENGVDRELIKGLIGSTAAGATYSSAALITGVIADLVGQPQALQEIREEIRQVNEEVDGRWTADALKRLEKLDSAMKETLRLAPGTLLIYSRVVNQDTTLSNGIALRKNQFICISGHACTSDSSLFSDAERYDALRSYSNNLEEHRLRPFNNVDAEDFRWGSGRWACPGRYIATMTAKVILVKLLDEYEWGFKGGVRPANSLVHEFVFLHPDSELLVRRRAKNSGIDFCKE